MNSSNLILKANDAIKNNQIHNAIKIFNDVLKIDPNSYEACSKLGLLNIKIGNLKASIEYFKKTIFINQNLSFGYSNLGLVYFKLNYKELALKNYLKAIELDPENFSINYNLGNFFFHYDDIDNAEKYYLSSIELQPKNFWPYNNLFQLYDRSNNLKKLDDIIKKILSIFERTPHVKFLEGISEFRKKNYKKTIKIFNELDISEKDTQRNVLKSNILAKCYDFIGLYSDAYKHFSFSNNIIENSTKNSFNKNRYIDHLKLRFNFIRNDYLKLNNNIEIEDKYEDPIFLFGFPRSGTTLLDTILRTHKLINVIEEKSLVDDVIIELNKNLDGELNKLSTLNDYSIKNLRNLYFGKRKDLVAKGKNLNIDKMPLNIIYIAELITIFPKAKFIIALRNPKDVVLSCFMQPFVPNDAMSNFYNLKDAAELYALVMELWKKYEERLNINFHYVKYEDVINNFDETVKGLLKFINVKWSEELKNFYLTAEKRGVIHTPSYNQINMPIYKNSISRWKNYYEKFSEINFLLDKWIKFFGY